MMTNDKIVIAAGWLSNADKFNFEILSLNDKMRETCRRFNVPVADNATHCMIVDSMRKVFTFAVKNDNDHLDVVTTAFNILRERRTTI